MTNLNPADWWARSRHSPEVIDRALFGLCALIWLVLLGMSVAATVALVDLGRGFHAPAKNPHTGLLYIVIGVSALIILAAIPLLLRARQAPPPRRVPQQRVAADPRVAGGRRAAVQRVTPAHHAEVNRVLLRGVIDLASIAGAALTAVAAATYLMALGKDTGAWVAYGVAGVITLATPVVPWFHLRQLRSVLGTAQRRR